MGTHTNTHTHTHTHTLHHSVRLTCSHTSHTHAHSTQRVFPGNLLVLSPGCASSSGAESSVGGSSPGHFRLADGSDDEADDEGSARNSDS